MVSEDLGKAVKMRKRAKRKGMWITMGNTCRPMKAEAGNTPFSTRCGGISVAGQAVHPPGRAD